MAIPIIISMLVQALYNIVDSIFIGNYDITVLGYSIGAVFMYIAIFKYGLLDTLQLVKDYVIDGMTPTPAPVPPEPPAPVPTDLISQIQNWLNNEYNTGIEVNGNIGKLIQLDKALAKAQNADVNLIDTHPEPTTGSVQVLLEWHNYNDLDLICVDPNGDAVWYRNKKVPSGGMLEIDMNAGSQYSSSPIENIYWPQSGAPKGTYNVGVLYYKRHDTQYATSDFKVTVRCGNSERLYQGTAQTQSETLKICEFTLE